MSDDTKEYRFVDTVPGELLGGQPIGPGEYVQLREEDLSDRNIATLIDEGKLISVEEQIEPAATDAARTLAKKNKLSLSAVTPTGSKGEITVGDVEKHLAEQQEEGT